MTAADHVNEADRLLLNIKTAGYGTDPQDLLRQALEAIGHALVALAIETGVPHTPPGTEAGTSG